MRRGGARPGSGRSRRSEPTVRIRIEKHERWTDLKMRRGFQSDNDVSRYLLNLADLADENVVPR